MVDPISKLVDLVVEKAANYAETEIIMLLGVEDEVNKLKDTAPAIQAVLEDADKQEALNRQDQDWINKLNVALHDADDLLDDFATEARKRQVMSGNKVSKEVCLFFTCSSNQLIYRHTLGKKLQKINARLEHIVKIRENVKFTAPAVTDSSQSKIRVFTDTSLPKVIIGRDADKQAVVKRLLGSESDDKVVPIIGVAGLGKTTLARWVYEDPEVRKEFDLPLWVEVPHSLDIKLILQLILENITKKKPEDLNVETLGDLVNEKLDGSKYLLVLDDIWDDDQDKWNSLMSKLRGGKAGSKIIITTRLKKVAQIPNTKIHRLKGLSVAESWNLLKQSAFRKGQVLENPGLEEIGKEIARECLGVPLLINTVGRLLHGKLEHEWLSFKDDELSKIAQNDNTILEKLKLSYNHLSPHLKRCFSYCSLFPERYEINVESLVQLWIVLGLVKPSNSKKALEVIGREYVQELWWRSFFHEVKKDSIGNITSFRMHDLMHELAVSVAGVEAITLNQNADNVSENTLHISFGFNLDASWQIPSLLLGAKNLQTFLLPSQKLGSKVKGMSKESFEAICSNFRKLRALDLHDLMLDQMSASIEKLKHLRYLDAGSNGGIDYLPIAVTKLPNLGVLKLSGCSELKELPKNITKLFSLKCLDCEGCWNLSHMPRGLGKLSLLETLTWFVVSDNSLDSKNIGRLDELGELNNLRGRIEIRNLRYVKDDKSESALAKLQDKKYLQSLTLSWNVEVKDNDTYSDYGERSSKCCSGDENVDVNDVVNVELDEKILESLKPNKMLKGLRVYEYGGVSFPGWLSSITNLVEIWIVNCKQCQHIPPLDRLPFLKDLWLSELSNLLYIDEREDPRRVDRTMSFPSLERLWIWNCPNLKGWWKKGNDDNDPDDETATSTMDLPEFLYLSLLEIRGCPKFTWLPKFSLSDRRLWFQDVDLARLQRVSPLGKVRFLNCLTPFSNIIEIWVRDCRGCRYFPPLDQIPSLEELYFGNVKDLEYIGTQAPNGSRGGKEGSIFFTSLKKLWLWRCPDLKGWWMDGNDDDDTTITTTEERPQFPYLSVLDIRECPQLIHLPLFPTLDDQLYLKKTSIQQFQQMLGYSRNTSIEFGDGRFASGLSSFTNIKELYLDGITDVEYISIESFPLLKKIWFWSCPNLKSLLKKSDPDNNSTPTATTGLPQFQNLSVLDIRHCRNLTDMPLFPRLDDQLYLENASIKPFVQTINLTTAAFTELKELWISKSDDLEYIGIEAFPFLKKVWLWECPNLKSWWKKSDPDNNSTPTATTGLPQFQNLSVLDIRHCRNLTEMPLFPCLDDQLYLENASIEPFLQTINLTTATFTELKELWISKSNDLQYIGIEAFPFLKKVWLWECPNLKSWWKKNDNDDTTAMTSMEFPALSLLDIRDCPRFTQMPLFPTLDTKLFLVRTSIEPFVQTMKLNSSSLTNLEELWLDGIPDLEFICIEAISTLKKVWIYNCPNLKAWGKEVDDNNCNEITKTETDLPSFRSLSLLDIQNCPKLSSMPLFPDLDDECRLENTSLQLLEKTMNMSASHIQPLTRLKKLQVQRIKDFESLPKWISNFSSLQQLFIVDCPELKSLPEWMIYLTGLQELKVTGCPLVNERCKEHSGADWHNISHIPNIYIDGRKIR